MTRMFRSLTGVLFLAILLAPGTIFAALTSLEQQYQPGLRQLYLQSLQSDAPDKALEDRIAAERARARKVMMQDLTAFAEAAIKEEEGAVTTEQSALQKQTQLVDALETRRKESAVDIDLLEKDDEGISTELDAAQTAAQRSRILQRRADLFARKAILQERESALDEALLAQRDRLSRMNAQRRLERFGTVIEIGMYIGILFLIIAAERLVRRTLIGRVRDRNRRYLATKIFTGAVYLALFGWLVYRIAVDFPGIVTSFAIVGAGFAVALQAVIKDVVGWIIIMQKRLFTLGQRVTIGPYTGDVADISLLRTTLVEVHNADRPDVGRIGQTLHLPNAMVLDNPVLNFHATSDFMEAEMTVLVDRGSDLAKAEEILLQILKEEVGQYVERARLQHVLRTAHFFATQEPPEPRVFTEFGETGVVFILRFQIPIGYRRMIVSRITLLVVEWFTAAEPPILLVDV